MAVQRIVAIETLASNMIGDGKSPNLFFVTLGKNVVLLCRDFSIAHRLWKQISQQRQEETTLEDRKTGVICSSGMEVMEDDTEEWMRRDDSRMHGFKPEY